MPEPREGFGKTGAYRHIRCNKRQHDEVRGDLQCDAEPRHHRQVLYHFDGDQIKRVEADKVGHERERTRHQKAAESRARRLIDAVAFAQLVADQVDLLHAMADTDCVDEEGHQNGERVEPPIHQMQEAELPDEGDHRAEDGEKGQLR